MFPVLHLRVPIWNTVVKPTRAHGTARATAWESRSSPAQYLNPAVHESGLRGFCFGATAAEKALEIKGYCPQLSPVIPSYPRFLGFRGRVLPDVC